MAKALPLTHWLALEDDVARHKAEIAQQFAEARARLLPEPEVPQWCLPWIQAMRAMRAMQASEAAQQQNALTNSLACATAAQYGIGAYINTPFGLFGSGW